MGGGADPGAPPRFAFRPAGDGRAPVVVVGAGPVGLSAAIDLGLRGQPVVLLDEDDTVAGGSRAICWAKRSLEIFDRLGVGAAMLERGVTWQIGKVFHREREVYRFDLLPQSGHRCPAFVNLQQYHVEALLAARARELPLIDARWRHRVTGVEAGGDGVVLTVETPAGRYRLEAGWVIAADGARSFIRRALGLDFLGRVFEDRFLIADVRMEAAFPPERWFWFDPPFNPGQSALLHRQPDGIWRIDLQLGPGADPEREREPGRVTRRLRAMLGEAARFSLEWVSVYTFQCRRLARLRHGRVLFAGDAAHQVSPFGARGGNSGIQDADNLAWKLAAVLAGEAPEALLDSYDLERGAAADENILASSRSTDFITPKGEASRAYRDAVLALAATHPFARRLVNSGRLSLPASYRDTPLNTPDGEPWPEGPPPPGAPLPDAPLAGGWLLHAVAGSFVLLHGGPAPPPEVPGLRAIAVAGVAADRLGLSAGGALLVRPDQHVCARWRAMPAAAAVAAARDRALGRDLQSTRVPV
ncbi:MAG: FAD-dependent oxidoreductase [Thalassobaculales bacterium]